MKKFVPHCVSVKTKMKYELDPQKTKKYLAYRFR